MLEILAQFARVPIASINRLSANQLEVYCVNHNPNNPYRVGTALPLNGEQFCETVLKNDKVFRIKNALESSDWHKKSPVLNSVFALTSASLFIGLMAVLLAPYQSMM
ncbi:hypothetical protein JCM19236_3711 [Vibrio sp. JCM 19236]|nr:hypothetical protein JCM19236_3711 [Vibrio sp. JCM 19236]